MAAELNATHGSEFAVQQMRELANSAIASGRPLSWYETLYKSAAAGTAAVPWDHCEPMPALVDWLHGRYPDARSRGSRAIVVACGYGHDAEFVASLGFTTTAFDISETAVETARRRHEHTRVDYQQADLLALPKCWLHGFDLVVESTTLQCLPRDLHDQAAAAVAALCAPGGTVLVIARQPSPSDPAGPPWLLAETEVRRVAANGVQLARLDTGEHERRCTLDSGVPSTPSLTPCHTGRLCRDHQSCCRQL